MKKLILAAVAATALAAPAFAQEPARVNGGSRTSGTQAYDPIDQRGSGTNAGGPANALPRGNGGAVAINPEEPARVNGGSRTSGTQAYDPPSQRGSGVNAGGPANDLRRNPGATGTVIVDPNDRARVNGGSRTSGTQANDPVDQRGSGVNAGGPANSLPRR